jgi:hypothetical protein
MAFPEFFEQIPALVLRDPLADTLGAAVDGLIEYRYADAVKLAGHSCPTVAGAWLMAGRALALLYPDALPVRGSLGVELRAPLDAGTAGVVGAVLGLITGAAGEGGFKGLGGAQARRNLLHFGADIAAEARVSRLDGGASVLLDYRPEAVPADPAMAPLMARVVGGVADGDERAAFARLWQERVRRILLEHADDPALLSARLAG